MKEFFLWAFFNRGGPPGDDDEELEGYIAVLEEQLGREIPEGRGNAKCLRLTLDEVVMSHRSLSWYFVSNRTRCTTQVRAWWEIMLTRLLIVCWVCGLLDILLSAVPRLSLPSDVDQTIPQYSSNPTTQLLDNLPLSGLPHKLLASSTHLENQTSDYLHPRHRHWSLPIYIFPQ